jgi:chromosome segregation ATPase
LALRSNSNSTLYDLPQAFFVDGTALSAQDLLEQYEISTLRAEQWHDAHQLATSHVVRVETQKLQLLDEMEALRRQLDQERDERRRTAQLYVEEQLALSESRRKREQLSDEVMQLRIELDQLLGQNVPVAAIKQIASNEKAEMLKMVHEAQSELLGLNKELATEREEKQMLEAKMDKHVALLMKEKDRARAELSYYRSPKKCPSGLYNSGGSPAGTLSQTPNVWVAKLTQLEQQMQAGKAASARVEEENARLKRRLKQFEN